MRISQQNIVQNAVNISKSQLTPNEAKALIGNIMEGRITAVQGQQLATLTTGDKQLTVNINGMNLQENQLVNLKITGYKDGALIAKLIGSNAASESNSSLTDMLSKLGISDQAENVTILEAMKSANIPITKDNFQMMRQGMSEVKALISELASSGQLPLENDLETPIKALAIKIIQQTTADGKTMQGNNASATSAETANVTNASIATATNASTVSATAGTIATGTATGIPAATNTTAVNASDEIANMTHPVENQASNSVTIPAKTTSDTLQNADVLTGRGTSEGDQINKIDLELMAKTIQLAFDKEGTSLKQSIQAMLGQFDYKQESLILKNDLPITLKNIFLAYDALNEEGGISNRFTEVVEGLETVPFSKESLLNIINVLTSEVSQEEKLETLLEAIRKEMPDSEMRQGLERELSIIKESTTLNKALNDQMMFMQMPIPFNDQIQNVDIYYKKNKKKPDPDDLTLLIALKTFNFGEVRCVVHKQTQTYTLNFSFNDEASMAYFETKKEQLTIALSTHKDKQFALNFAVKSSLPEFQLSDSTDFESFGFDLKV
ncbi:MAG TPA: hypothetical protein VLS94_11000 [Fusibacter sp.]|nr:hypothetical protein [Fusibacter sp.]